VELNANQRLPHGDVAICRIHQWDPWKRRIEFPHQ
jgi:hypothetical protein